MGVMNNVSEKRYHNAVDGMENGMEDLEIRDGHLTAQIRIVFSTIGRQPAAKTAGPPPI